jgi:Sulfotransferase domain
MGNRRRDDMAVSAAPRNLPSILLTAIPKSGGLFIRTVLAQSLRLEEVGIDSGHFPYSIIMPKPVVEFLNGGQICHNHIDASAANLWYLRQTGIKLVVHLRDPRPALLSWLHHINTAEAEVRQNPKLLWMHPVIDFGPSYFDLPMTARLDLIIEHYGPVFVGWIEDWLKAESAGGLDMLVTTYEQFLADRSAFMARILNFYGIPADQYEDKFAWVWDRRAEYNYRRGDNNEWRTVFTGKQQRDINSMIPRELAERFGWSLGSRWSRVFPFRHGGGSA